MEFTLSTFWFIMFLIFLGAELLTAISLVTIWFCLGALLAMVTSWTGASFLIQMVVFLLTSIALLVGTKPFVKKHIYNHQIKTNVDAVVGLKGIVLEDINNLDASGLVKVDGKIWTARSLNDNDKISTGEHVIVDHIEGVKVMVRREE